MQRVMIGALALSASALANGQAVKETVYNMVVADDVRVMCRSLGVAEPKAKLVLRSDSTFRLSSESGGSERTAEGRFTVYKGALGLAYEGLAATPLSVATFSDDRVVLDGITYERLSASFRPGVWTLRRSGSEDGNIRFTFDANGRFSFSGMDGTSRGAWRVEDDSLLLQWSEIDGKPVDKGATVRKRVPLGQGYFQIDQFRYEPRQVS